MIGQKSALGLAVALVAAGFGASATRAQEADCRLCAATPETAARPIRLEVRSRLDFDSLIFAGTGSGHLMLGPDGSYVPLGGISATGSRAMPGSVTILGEPGRAVRVLMPATVHLVGERGQVQIESLVTDLPAFPTIGRDGELTFRFGGKLKIDGDLDGSFRGDIDIVVDYL